MPVRLVCHRRRRTSPRRGYKSYELSLIPRHLQSAAEAHTIPAGVDPVRLGLYSSRVRTTSLGSLCRAA